MATVLDFCFMHKSRAWLNCSWVAWNPRKSFFRKHSLISIDTIHSFRHQVFSLSKKKHTTNQLHGIIPMDIFLDEIEHKGFWALPETVCYKYTSWEELIPLRQISMESLLFTQHIDAQCLYFLCEDVIWLSIQKAFCIAVLFFLLVFILEYAFY